MGGMEQIGKNSPKSNFHKGGQNLPPTLPGNSKPPPFLGLIMTVYLLRLVVAL
jgi:hypothetical protein